MRLYNLLNHAFPARRVVGHGASSAMRPPRHPTKERLPVLDYDAPSDATSVTAGLPWGVASLTFGIASAAGVPGFDAVTHVPGYLQAPIIAVGMAAGVVAVAAGIAAALLRVQPTRGLIGAALGLVGLLLTPTIMRA